jgi:hypothetical protein
MWQAIVERAIQEQVDLITLSGDIVDHDNRFFEATGPLEAGLTKLAAAGIQLALSPRERTCLIHSCLAATILAHVAVERLLQNAV